MTESGHWLKICRIAVYIFIKMASNHILIDAS